MYEFGKTSRARLETCDYRLVRLVETALSKGILDLSVVEGHRPKERQNKFYNAVPQKSKVKWPKGKHNKVPSLALDIAPYINGDISWNKLHCCVMAGIILSCAKELHIEIRWGGNWNMDSEPITDQDFQDLVHFELVE